MPMLSSKFTFEDGTVQELKAPELTLSFVPLNISDVYRSPTERRKRPVGPSMTPHNVRHNTYSTFIGSYDDVIFNDSYRELHGWYYTTRCDGSSDPVPPAASYSSTIKRTGLLGGGGVGVDYLYFQSNRLKLPVKRFVTTSSIPTAVQLKSLVTSDGLHIDDIQSKIDDLKRKVVADTLDAYDAGTEFAERTKTIQTIYGIVKACVSPLNTLRKALASYKSRPGSTLSDHILQYEYAIRPLLYSMEQIRKIQKDSWKLTIRKSRSSSLTFSTDSVIPTKEPSLYERGSMVVKLRACSYYHFEDELDRVTSSLRFNPLTTAWELIPFSFVVDWFVGVGDWLVNQTASLTRLGANALFCVTVRRQGSYDLVYNPGALVLPPWENTVTFTDTWGDNTCFQQDSSIRKGSGTITLSKTLKHPREVIVRDNCAIARTIINDYSRSLFTPSEVPIELNDIFSLSKRRLLDAVCLLASQLR